MTSEKIQHQIAVRLEELREKLLDLSARNKLLNFRHTKTNSIRAVDELPNQLFDHLRKGHRLYFAPVPFPTDRELAKYRSAEEGVPRARATRRPLTPPPAEEWAQHCGIEPRYDPPVDTGDSDAHKHRDNQIQTLLYPEELESRLRKVRNDARTAIEESGANMLYLAFGFLQWCETVASDKTYLAPLVLMPVELSREPSAEGRYRYSVSWTGEDLQTNLSLQKKVEIDFGLALPDLDDQTKPEKYFECIRRVIRPQQDWRVRRFVTLALFHFGKLLVYRDLDPTNWPDAAAFEGNPVVRRLLLGDEGGDAWPGTDSVDIDAESIDLRLELVDRADSSQATALARALDSQSMVIQGPPGTGKSQTITNLVAAALARGKSVLFVSEKLAALEVVQRRLADLGLSEFCLELHSHKTRKQALIESLKRRLSMGRVRPPQAFDRVRAKLSEKRAELERYATQIAQPVGALGWPAHRVLFEAGSIRRQLGQLTSAVVQPAGFDPLAVSEADLDRARAALVSIYQRTEQIAEYGEPRHHPWAGVSAAHVLSIDARTLADAASDWANKLNVLSDTLKSFRESYQLDEEDWPLVESISWFQRLARDLHAVRRAVRDVERLRERVRDVLAFGDCGQGLETLQSTIELAASAPFSSLSVRCPELLQGEVDDGLAVLGQRIDNLNERERRLKARIDLDADLDADVAKVAAVHLARRGLFRIFSREWRSARKLARHIAPTGASKGPRASDLVAFAEWREARKELDSDQGLRRIIGPSFRGAATDIDALRAVRSWFKAIEQSFSSASQLVRAVAMLDAQGLRSLETAANDPAYASLQLIRTYVVERNIAEPPWGDTGIWQFLVRDAVPGALAEVVLNLEHDHDWTILCDAARRTFDARLAAEEAERLFAERSGLDRSLWFAQVDANTIKERGARANRAAESPDALAGWLSFQKAFAEVSMSGAVDVARQAFDGTIPFDRAEDVYNYLLFDNLGRAIFRSSEVIRKYGSVEHGELRAQFRSLDEQLMELRREQIASDLARRTIPQGRAGATASSYTDLALVHREIGKQRRHIPVRDLVNRAGSALQALNPCFMMGPLSVAQYLPPGKMTFDLVIFDEASQVRPEDAVGALARGKQAVIVGDSRQLPPTTFFDRINVFDADGEDDDGDGVGYGVIAESVLEVAEGRLPTEMLRWHYRSDHESLIAFSNARFYDGRLLLFPSRHRRSDRYGVKFHHVTEGQFQSRRNRPEAEHIADAAVAHLRSHPGRSLGVVAMNIEQRDLIQQIIDRKMQDDPALLIRAEDYEQRAEPFFVKNLENVQGDERDVIFISMTYGPSAPGARTHQRFGPISGVGGERRLNVLFTRAKERMEIFSSMRHGNIVIANATQLGPRALKSFLYYAETGMLEEAPLPSDRPMDSDFEAAVYEGLRSLGYSCDPQVGSAGYYIDLAVRDPDDDTSFLLGIECDGAAYHSTKSARDRDRLRQDILEDKLGWTIERVWSTDWFQDADRELERLRVRIEELREERRAHKHRASTRQRDPVSPAESNVPIQVPPALDFEDDRTALLDGNAEPVLGASLNVEDVHQLLIDLREREIRPAFPSSDPSRGLLRKSMLSELLKVRPTTLEEFQRGIRCDLRENTDGSQLKAFGARVFSILEQIAD